MIVVFFPRLRQIHDNDNDNDNDNENMFITTDIYSISETNARHKYIGKSIKQ